MKHGFLMAGCAALLLTFACSDEQRCKADLSLAEACKDGHCPADLSDAASKVRACEFPYFEVWREGEHRAIGVVGPGAILYYFDGTQLVGREFADDQLTDDSCPLSSINGERTVNSNDYRPYDDTNTVEYCTACDYWVSEPERPRCTAEQLGGAE